MKIDGLFTEINDNSLWFHAITKRDIRSFYDRSEIIRRSENYISQFVARCNLANVSYFSQSKLPLLLEGL